MHGKKLMYINMINSHSNKVSIITVVYNGEKYIENTINSVLSQSYKNIEFIIIDGESKDNTMNIVNKFRDKIDIIISEKDNGLSDAMNKGVKLANGEYIIHMHSDDMFTTENSLAKLVNKIDSEKGNWVTGFYKYINEKNEIVGFDIDLLKYIANDLGVEVKFQQVTSKTRIPLVSGGQIDIAAASMTHKVKRDEAIDFTITYFFDGQSILARKDYQANNAQDFNGKKVGAIQGATSGENFKKMK